MSDNRSNQGFDDWFSTHFGEDPPDAAGTEQNAKTPPAGSPDGSSTAVPPMSPPPHAPTATSRTATPPPNFTTPAPNLPPPLVVPQQHTAPQASAQFPAQQQPLQPPVEYRPQNPPQAADAWPQTPAAASPQQPTPPLYQQQPIQRPLMPQQPVTQARPAVPDHLPQPEQHSQSFAPQQHAHPSLDASLRGQDALPTEHLPSATRAAAAGADESSALDSLFGDDKFRDYASEPIESTAPSDGEEGNQPGGISATHITLMWIAGSAVALLALFAFFLVGTRLPMLTGTGTTPSAEPTPTATERPEGPVAPGTYNWNELLGGECLDDFRGAWENQYTVVDCASPHAAQLVVRAPVPVAPGTGGAYPGVSDLQSRMNLLCTDATVIDYGVANQYDDVQFEASFPPSVTEWDAGQRDYFCFVSRASGQPFEGSLVAPPAPEEPVDESTEGTEGTESTEGTEGD